MGEQDETLKIQTHLSHANRALANARYLLTQLGTTLLGLTAFDEDSPLGHVIAECRRTEGENQALLISMMFKE